MKNINLKKLANEKKISVQKIGIKFDRKKTMDDEIILKTNHKK
jgi:hypothetical protein